MRGVVRGQIVLERFMIRMKEILLTSLSRDSNRWASCSLVNED